MKLIFFSLFIFFVPAFWVMAEGSGYYLCHFEFLSENDLPPVMAEPVKEDKPFPVTEETQKRNEEINKAIKVIQITETKRLAGLLSIFPAQIAAITAGWFFFKSEDQRKEGENYFFKANNSFSQKEIDSNFERANYFISKSNNNIMYRNIALSTALFFTISTIYFYFSDGK